MTLVEVAVSFTIFAVIAGGVVASIIQARKLSESNLAQSYAHSLAQAVIEEVVRVPPSMLADTGLPTVGIKLAKLTASNHTSMEDFALPWSDNATEFTDIGTTDMTDQGVLIDAAYIAASNTIRPERFMRMRLNLQRFIEADTDHRIRVILRYQWEVPDRKGANGAPIFLTGEVRTVRSTALRF